MRSIHIYWNTGHSKHIANRVNKIERSENHLMTNIIKRVRTCNCKKSSQMCERSEIM